MKRLKSSFILLLIVSFCLTFVSPVYADTGVTISDKAEALDILSLLSGDGNGDYLLEKPLLRSEAAAFIVRLLGKTSYVLENSKSLSVTEFSDVDSNKWYAPYVGYCTGQGIIAGVGDGKYDPDEKISEQAFLKLLIMTLGYDYGTDFTWSNVFKKAYEIGLVNDKGYLTKTQDNINYLRENVVNAMYNALTKINNKIKVTLLQGLMNENVVTRDQAISAGLVRTESSPVSISQTMVVSQNGIFLIFDKKVENIAIEDIKIYETGDSTKKLDVSIQAQQPDTLVINTSNQTAYLDYTVEISNVTAAGDILANTIITHFEGFKASEVKSDFFKISKIVPVSNSVVNVYFTHPINTSSENASYYEILEGTNVFAQGSMKALTAKFASSPDNMVVISLQGSTFKEGKQYTLKVSGELSSIYAVKLNEGQEDSLRFSVTGLSSGTTPNTSFNMTKISLLDYKTMQLEFNLEVNPTHAQQIYRYYITDPNGNQMAVSKAVVGGSGTQRGKFVYVSINSAFIKTSNYKVMLIGIDDISAQYSINEQEHAFSGAYPERTILSIQSVSAVNKNMISVYFDRPLDETAAKTKEYYSVAGITQTGFSTIPVKVMFDPDINSNKVNLYLPSDKELVTNNIYKLTVLGTMKDNLGYMAGENKQVNFYGNGTTGAKPFISDAVIISKDTIKVTTNTDISLNKTNIDFSNYSLEYDDSGRTSSKVPLIVGFINSTTLVLKFDTLDFNKEYTLRFNSLTDYSELYTRTAVDGQNFFKVRLGK